MVRVPQKPSRNLGGRASPALQRPADMAAQYRQERRVEISPVSPHVQHLGNQDEKRSEDLRRCKTTAKKRQGYLESE